LPGGHPGFTGREKLYPETIPNPREGGWWLGNSESKAVRFRGPRCIESAQAGVELILLVSGEAER